MTTDAQLARLAPTSDDPAQGGDPTATYDLSTEDGRIQQLNTWYTISESAQAQWERQAREDLSFYLGRQWDAKDLQTLDQENRPALTFNYLLGMVNLVSGLQRQNRQDWKAYPQKDGTRQVAEVLTALLKHIKHTSQGDWHEAMAFVYGCVTGKAFLSARVDYDRDPTTGELVYEWFSPFRVKHDPFHDAYDLNDGDYVFKDRWLPRGRIERMFPDAKERLAGVHLTNADMVKQGVETTGYTQEPAPVSHSRMDIARLRLRVREGEWKDYETQRFLLNVESGKMVRLDMGRARAKALIQNRPAFKYFERTRPRFHHSVWVGNVELFHEIDHYPGQTRFTTVPFFAYWIEGESFGLITHAKDPQREANKRKSQALHHLNQSANSGWVYEEGSVTNEDDLEEFGSKPGLHIKYRQGRPKPERLHPSPISEGHLTLGEMGYNEIKRITGVNADLLGVTGPQGQAESQSGIAMLRRQQQGAVVLESVFDNFRFTKLTLGQVLLELIQKSGAYSNQEVLTLLVDGEVQQVPINVRQQSLAMASERVLNDLSLGSYGVTIDMQTSTPTTRMANFEQLIGAVKAGVPIPPEAILAASDIPDKEQIIESIQAQQAQARADQQAELAAKTAPKTTNGAPATGGPAARH